MDTLSIVIDWVLTHTESWHRQGWISTQLYKDVVEAVCVGCVVCCVCVCGGGCARIVHVWCPCVCVCVCVWKGGRGTAPAEAYHFDSNGMHIYFYEGHSIDTIFSSLAPNPSLPVHKFRSLDLWIARRDHSHTCGVRVWLSNHRLYG